MAAIRKQKLSTLVVEEIQRRLASNELKVGDRLPDHGELAKQLNVSRVTLREAMHTLEMLDVIEQRSGAGTYIKATFSLKQLEGLRWFSKAGGKARKELLDVRSVLELGAMDLVAEHITSQDIADIEALAEKMEQALAQGQLDKFSQKDLEFHRALVQASHNRYLSQLYELLCEATGSFLTEAHQLKPSRLNQVMSHHKAILTGLRSRDMAAAQEALVCHIHDRDKAYAPKQPKLKALPPDGAVKQLKQDEVIRVKKN